MYWLLQVHWDELNFVNTEDAVKVASSYYKIVERWYIPEHSVYLAFGYLLDVLGDNIFEKFLSSTAEFRFFSFQGDMIQIAK